MSLTARAAHRQRAVVVELSAYDAHDLGRYLHDTGMRENDHVWEDGAELVKAAHQLAGRCPQPTDCPLPEVGL